MKALILKDFYNIMKSMQTVAIIIVLYGIFGIVMGDGSFLSAMIAVICAMLPISTFSYDNFAKWDSYALSMPISRSQIVLSKYMFSIVMLVVGCVLTLLFSGISFAVNGVSDGDIMNQLSATGAIVVLCLVVLSILLPVIIKIGPEKGRVVMFAIFFVPTGIFALLAKISPNLFSDAASLEHFFKIAIIAAPIIAILLLIVSYFVSVKIYSAKEF